MLIGLVGKPSVGKSTFFKAATLSEIEITQLSGLIMAVVVFIVGYIIVVVGKILWERE